MSWRRDLKISIIGGIISGIIVALGIVPIAQYIILPKLQEALKEIQDNFRNTPRTIRLTREDIKKLRSEGATFTTVNPDATIQLPNP